VRRVLRLLRQERGYSLVELLTVMVIMSVVLGGLTQLFVSGSNAEVDMNRRFQAQQAARVAMDRLRRDIHCSSAAVPPTATPPAASTVLTLTDPCVSGGYVSWCTVSSVGPGGATWYSLYRKLAATCDNTGSDYADSLVNPSGNVFTYAQQSTSSLSSVAVDVQVNLKPSLAQSTYKLDDTIVLRNSSRTCVTSSPTTFASPNPPCP